MSKNDKCRESLELSETKEADLRQRLAAAHDEAGMKFLSEHDGVGWADVPTALFVDAILVELRAFILRDQREAGQ